MVALEEKRDAYVCETLSHPQFSVLKKGVTDENQNIIVNIITNLELWINLVFYTTGLQNTNLHFLL